MSWFRRQVLSRLLQRVRDVVFVAHVLVTLLRQLGFLCCDQSPLIRMELSRVAGKEGDARFQDEAKQVVRILAQNAVGLSLREGKRSSNFPNPTHVITLVGVQWREHLIRSESHWREELYAIGLSLSGEQHHSIVQTISALLR